MKAIIVAAGYGSRMYPLAQDIPKCVLPFHNDTILGRQLRILRDCGILDVTIVVGFHKEAIIDRFGEEVSIRYNPHYEITNNLFSLWIARDTLTDDTLILNADMVFTEEPIQDLIADERTYVLGTDNKSLMREDARRVRVVHGLVTESSKTLPIAEAFGEATGMAKVRREGIEEFKNSMLQVVKQDSQAGWPDTFTHLASRGFEVHCVLVNTPWMEIDTKEDYEEVQKLLL